MRGWWIAATLVASAWLCNERAAAQAPTVAVTGGRVEGVLSHGVLSFKGIPFAAPPVGNLRWKDPQPVEAWQGVRKADRYGPSCMQDPQFATLFGAPPAIGEDCLYLNVWTPAKRPRAQLPVMVWIYGGGFVGGMTSIPAYEGTRFAERGVVLVSVGYRLGAFGFLADEELSRESGHGSGNYGLLDMIAGLKWVKANIARFGGDPRRVTVFGESAGGMAVSMLAASPLAAGLFQGVIAESGANFGPPQLAGEGAGTSVRALALAEATGQRFLSRLGAENIGAARRLGANVIQKAEGPGLQGRFWPVLDGYVIPGDEYELYRRGLYNDTPILVGTNSDEGSLFVTRGMRQAQFESQVHAAYGAQAPAILAVYPHATDAQATQAARDVLRDSTFGWGAWTWVRLQSQQGRGPAFLYYFDHRTPQSPKGASHAAELGYVFGTLGGAGGGPSGLRGPPRPEDLALSSLMMSYWVNFARSGNPNGPGLPSWPAFKAAAQQVMYLDAHPGAGPVPNLRQIKTLDGYFASRRAAGKTRATN